MRPSQKTTLLVGIATILCSGNLAAMNLDTNLDMNLSGKGHVLMTFAGKGTQMAWDVGVMRAVWEEVPAIRQGKVIIAGSSSGSVLASALGCRGFTEEGVQAVETGFTKFDRSIVNESPLKNLMALLGLPTEAEHSTLDHLLEVVLDGQNCTPQFPMLIPAGNFELLDVRTNKPLLGRKDRRFNIADFTVTRDGQNLGKACTYFVNKPMQSILASVPKEELLCDLRPISTNKEMRMALLASVSEPSYFEPIVDPEPEKIIRSERGVMEPLKRRSYWGGAIMDIPVQDIKRALPEIHTISTGRAPFMQIVDKVMANISLVELNPLIHRANWFLDFEVTMTPDMAADIIKPGFEFPQQIKLGYSEAKKCLISDRCMPPTVIRPELSRVPDDHPSGLTGDLAPYTRRGIKSVDD